MSTALIILAEGFEEVEAITITDLLRRADINVTTASLSRQKVIGSHNITIYADELFEKVIKQDFDIIILPGGPGTKNLRESKKVTELVRQQYYKGKYIAAICAAPTVLQKAGILENTKVTSYPAEKSTFNNENYRLDNVVVDGKIITSRAVGTAIEFTLEIIKQLKDSKTADEVAEKILFN